MDLLPSSVYSAPTREQASGRRPDHLTDTNRTSLRRGRPAAKTRPKSFAVSEVSPVSDEVPTPRKHDFAPSTRSVSPSSSFDSAPRSWSTLRSAGTEETNAEFDDLYDVSEDELENQRRPTTTTERHDHDGDIDFGMEKGEIPIVIIRRMESVSDPENAAYDPSFAANRRRLPSLDIPSAAQVASYKSATVLPTPPAKIPISPAVLSLLCRGAPTSTAPPSLDGSSMSEMAATSTAPTTPSLDVGERSYCSWDDGIQLNREALATLQSFSAGEVQEPVEPMVEIPATRPSQEPRQDSIETVSRQTLAGLTGLDIPSPGGFFSSLNNSARHTWCPPSSATAEHFYKAPWNLPPPGRKLKEQVVEVDRSLTEGEPTPSLETPRALPHGIAPVAAIDNIVTTEVDVEYDEDYEKNLQLTASASLDRTSSWLHTQTEFLENLRDAIHPGIFGGPAKSGLKSDFGSVRFGSLSSSAITTPGKKSVHFLDEVQKLVDKAEHTGPESQDAIFWRAFQEMIHISNLRDALLYSKPRFDALQIKRVCAPEAHCDQLMGNYQANKATVTRDPEDVALLTVRDKLEGEQARDAEEQMKASAWNVTAAKILNGGSLLISPAAKRIPRKPARILDLGGQSVCDWAWHCAEEFPQSDVYTVVKEDLRREGYSNLRGPTNHRQITVPRLYHLPFPDQFFEVISARSLYSQLKTDKPAGEKRDEYDLCLRECLRCLKPGGYLEYSMFDSDIMNAGPLGSAKAVEFGYNLRTRGYDSTPTRGFLGRLKRAGFTSLKRSWIVLPMGTSTRSSTAFSLQVPDVQDNGPITERDIMTGSTADAACLSCLVGSLAWEKWMLKLQMESGRERDRLLEGVSAVVQEGRECGAAWRCLSGWAKKPLSLETAY